MTGRLFKEYLEWFDGLIYGRKVILLIDGFSAHKTGIDLHADEIHGGLRNTTIIFLPKNATALCQLLDQGIIKAWKSYYRRKWLQYMVDQMDLYENPKISTKIWPQIYTNYHHIWNTRLLVELAVHPL